jgi:hypothetical protein
MIKCYPIVCYPHDYVPAFSLLIFHLLSLFIPHTRIVPPGPIPIPKVDLTTSVLVFPHLSSVVPMGYEPHIEN